MRIHCQEHGYPETWVGETCPKCQVDILREALESLLVYTKHIKRRAGVQMNDPNTGSVLAAEQALQRAGGEG